MNLKMQTITEPITRDCGRGSMVRFIAEGDGYIAGDVAKQFNHAKIQFAVAGSKNGWTEIPKSVLSTLIEALKTDEEVKRHMDAYLHGEA